MKSVLRASREAAPRDEAPYTLDEPAPKVLGFWDQSAFWANLGVSLFAFSGAYTVLAPDEDGAARLPVTAGIAAMVVGTVLGGLMLGLAAVPGARTGRPAMVLLRGLFGARLSYVPTALNIVQLIGWGTFELIVIADAARQLYDGVPRWAYAVAAGLLTTVLAIWPLGSVRLLRRYVTAAVMVALVYFYVQLLREPLPDLGLVPGSGSDAASWSLFWVGADAALAVSISWVPLAADYTRHARSARGAFGAATVAYAVTQIVAYVLGLLALALVAGNSAEVYSPFLGVTLGAWFFAVFVLREADQSFANVYSTAVSIQNIVPRADRRVLAVLLGAMITGLALVLDMGDYAGFLSLIGSLFVPMLGVLAVDFFLGRGRRGWDLSAAAPPRWGMIAAWALGFVAYQLINPGTVAGWSAWWTDLRDALGFAPQTWMSASLLSFLVAGLAAGVIGRLRPGRGTVG
ncbi:putative hydroxymethylpyrimidine transporter CytX [Thermomonospora echinospora]|uniref:Putative hydroxymethylpyrimidine transporter CytX n=1 Tax=Thermomonospora echinospora TaxID=1992 RepID=A0A1H6CTV5_9ACTN|nr:cytosine permease [Thermomonospora echinospora]SEG76394.1 putative hydroxymethylpyrimidine transporter CytX [Thermomonospora echinospora]